MNMFKSFLRDKYLSELATIDGVENEGKLSLAINAYLTNKDYDVNKEPKLITAVQKIVRDKWDGDWNSFLDAVHKKPLKVTKTRIVPYSEIMKGLKRGANKDFFDAVFDLQGDSRPQRGKGEILLALFFKNITNAVKKGDVMAGKRPFEIKASGNKGWRPIGNKQDFTKVRQYSVLQNTMTEFIETNKLEVDASKLMSSNAMSINKTVGSAFHNLFDEVMKLDKEKQIEFIKIMTQYFGPVQNMDMPAKVAALRNSSSIDEFRTMLLALNIHSYIKAEKIESLGIWNQKNDSLLILSPDDIKTFDAVHKMVNTYGLKPKEGPDKRYYTFRVIF